VIALDAHGADRGAATVAEGARLARVAVTLFGPASQLGAACDEDWIEVVDSPLAIAAAEEPARAARAKPEASIVKAAVALAEGRAEALVSAGPTGAALAASLFHVKRMKGVHRPAIAALVPVPGRPVLLLDAGANVEVRPEHLVQFAYMGAAFMEAVHGLERPRVGLLSVGEEPQKGTPDVVEAHARLAAGTLDFVGNVEGQDLTAGAADVIVTDGFTGNVALKALEGSSRAVVHAIRDAVRSGPVSSLGGLLIRGKISRLRQAIDPNTAGGAILLGLRGVVVIAHGGSSAEGIAAAIRVARRAVDEGMVARTTAALEDGAAMRSASAASVAHAHD